jgi:hypothetical protein
MVDGLHKYIYIYIYIYIWNRMMKTLTIILSDVGKRLSRGRWWKLSN